MVDLYNKFIDVAEGLIGNLLSTDIVKQTKESIKNNADIQGILKDVENNQLVKPYLDFVRNANNNKVVKFEFGGNNYSLDCEKRRKIVYFVMGGLLFRYLLKMKYFRKFLFNYIIFSALLCRENFNLNNYKIDTLPSTTIINKKI